MKSVTLGFKAFDPHELLPCFVAREAGLFRDLQVSLVDISFYGDHDLPRDCFQASCGAALASAVQGFPQRVLVIATDRPMFWLYSEPGIRSADGLKGKKLAGYPPETPPAKLTRMVLNRLGLDPENDLALLPARDDVSRSGLLRTGHCSAA